jgi:hypothetical protein
MEAGKRGNLSNTEQKTYVPNLAFPLRAPIILPKAQGITDAHLSPVAKYTDGTGRDQPRGDCL